MSKPALKHSQSVQSEQQNRELGQQLEAQYHKCIIGMVDYIAFGALVLQVREIVSTADTLNAKGTGLKAWLEEFAPGVSRPTAYRCLELAEGIKAEFQLGARSDLYRILKGSDLSEGEASKREKIIRFVEGKSQRQLLLYIGKPDAKQGGKRESEQEKTPEQRHAEWIEAARSTAVTAFSALHDVDERWKLLDDDQLKLAVEDAERFAKQAKKWLETPPPARPAVEVEKYLEAQKQEPKS
jgi:hypothetical protein